MGAAVAESVEPSATDRRARVLNPPAETPSCTLMAPGACKIRRGFNVLEVLIQIISPGPINDSFCIRDKAVREKTDISDS